MRAKLVIGRDNIRCAPISIDIRPPVCFALHFVKELEKISTCTLIYDIFARVCSYHVVVADTTERVCVLTLRRNGRQSRILVVKIGHQVLGLRGADSSARDFVEHIMPLHFVVPVRIGIVPRLELATCSHVFSS